MRALFNRYASRLALLLLIGCSLVLPGCTDTNQTAAAIKKTASSFGQNAKAFANSPAGQALISSLMGAAANAAVNVGVQYGMTGKIDPRQIVMAGLDGGAAGMRSLGATVNTSAVTSSVAAGTGVPAVAAVVAPIAAQSVQTQVKSGVPPAVATENVAIIMNSVAAHPEAIPAPSPVSGASPIPVPIPGQP